MNKMVAGRILVGMAIVFLGIAFIVYPLIESIQIDKQFTLAKEQFENGNENEGIKIFVSIKDKKGDEILNYLNTYINDLCNEKKLSEAENVIDALILDSVLEKNKILSDDELTKLKQKVIYEQAEKLVNDKKYTDAYFKYMQIKKYKDSTEKATKLVENYKEDFYNLAISYVESEDWKKAKSLLKKLGDYKKTYFLLSYIKGVIKNKKLEENRPKEPAIGMTAEQVEASTWGKPKDINKTTTKYGVSEQWVYSDYRYIYLEDGIVTAITE